MARLTDTGASTANVDRAFLGGCAAAWLAALGAAVAATVALTDLGTQQTQAPSGSGQTPWLLYTVIGVSAAVIIAAVPLLLRARRTAETESAPAPLVQGRPAPGSAPEPPTERMRAVSPAPVPTALPAGYPTDAVDQVWLRSVLAVVTAMGVAVTAIGAATYLMAVDSDTAAWALYGVAAVVTLAMPVALWWHLRRLQEILEPTV